MSKRNCVVVDGIKFYQRKNGYYMSSTLKPLHRYIWEKFNGPIPDGYHIHHKDRNPGNNDITNLELISAHDHMSMHGKEKVETIEKMRESAKAWHSSGVGKEWHKQQYQKYVAPHWAQKSVVICSCCGKNFEVSSMIAARGGPLYCSKTCVTKARRLSQIDDEERVCVICGRTFRKNRYSDVSTCSKECGISLSWKRRKENQSGE